MCVYRYIFIVFFVCLALFCFLILFFFLRDIQELKFRISPCENGEMTFYGSLDMSGLYFLILKTSTCLETISCNFYLCFYLLAISVITLTALIGFPVVSPDHSSIIIIYSQPQSRIIWWHFMELHTNKSPLISQSSGIMLPSIFEKHKICSNNNKFYIIFK